MRARVRALLRAPLRVCVRSVCVCVCMCVCVFVCVCMCVFQLRILSGDLEPSTGDVVKSSADLKLGFLRQEFVDERQSE